MKRTAATRVRNNRSGDPERRLCACAHRHTTGIRLPQLGFRVVDDHRDSHLRQRPLSRAARAVPGCLTCCVPHLAAHLCHGPSPGPALAPARLPCLAALCPGLALLVPAADAGPSLAAVAASDAGPLAPAGVPCFAVPCPGFAPLAPAADAGPPLAVAAAPEAGLSGHSAEKARARRRASDRLRFPVAAVVRVGPVQRLAGLKMAAWNRVGLAAGNFFP